MTVCELSWRKFAIVSMLDIVDRFEYPVCNSYKRNLDEEFNGSSLDDLYGYTIDSTTNSGIKMCLYHKTKLERAFTIVRKVLDNGELEFASGFRYYIKSLDFEGVYDSTQDHDNIVSGYLNLDAVEIGLKDVIYEFLMTYDGHEVRFILTRDILEFFGCKTIAMYILQLYHTEKLGAVINTR